MLYKEMVAELTKPVEELQKMSDKDLAMIYAVMGIAGEVGEVCDAFTAVKQMRMMGTLRVDADVIISLSTESGDMLWYMTALTNAMDTELGLVDGWQPETYKLSETLLTRTSALVELVKKRTLNCKDIPDSDILVALNNVLYILMSMAATVNVTEDQVKYMNELKLRARLGSKYSDEKQAAKGELDGQG